MQYVRHLMCVMCGSTTPAVPTATTCPACKTGILDVVYDYDEINKRWQPSSMDNNKDQSIWKFLPLLPIDPEAGRPRLRTGNTPLIQAPRAAEELGLARLWVKDEGSNPTGSLKDRASAVGVVKATEAGARVIACSSTGNAASSLAGQAASVGIKTAIFVPGYAAQGKLAQLLIFGANVFSVQGSYLQAYELSQQAVARYGWYNRNCAVNPYLVEGKKTAGLEIAQQLLWSAPDWVVVSVGDGCTVAGIFKGFTDLYQLGWIGRLPKILAVQAEGSPAIYTYWKSGTLAPGPENTMADGISVGVPRNAEKAVRAIKASGGASLLVSDDEIREGMRWLGRTTGVFAEPAAAAAAAGLKKARVANLIEPGASVVLVCSGSGLKDVKNAIEAAGAPRRVEPSLDSLSAALPAGL